MSYLIYVHGHIKSLVKRFTESVAVLPILVFLPLHGHCWWQDVAAQSPVLNVSEGKMFGLQSQESNMSAGQSGSTSLRNSHKDIRRIQVDLDEISEHIQYPKVLNQTESVSMSDELVDDSLEKDVSRMSHLSPQIRIPLPSGENVWVSVKQIQVLSKALSTKYPRIKTYRLTYEEQGHFFSGSMDITPQGLHVMLETASGTVFIDPEHVVMNEEESPIHRSRFKQAQQNVLERCGVDDHFAHAHANKSFVEYGRANYERTNDENADFSNQLESAAGDENIYAQRVAVDEIRVYRLALAVTGEYTQYHGGTKELALSAMVTTINRVNQVFERDLAIRLELIDEIESLIHLDPDSDPYSNHSNSVMMSENQRFIDQVIGSERYDIGHVFGTTGGGIARIASVCDLDKASAATGHYAPRGDYFDIDFVAHEIGHQLSAAHSFNGTTAACSNRNNSSAFEPGSGSTIMAYAGLCGGENLQSHSDPMFHASSIAVILNYVTTGRGSRCGDVIPTNNTAPEVDAGRDFVIPANTPFELKGVAYDTDGDQLTYSWEQFNLGAESQVNDMDDEGQRPIFRSFMPVSEPYRMFPKRSDVMNNTKNLGEWLPKTSRRLDFRLTVRDGESGIGVDDMLLDVDDLSGPFRVITPQPNEFLSSRFELQWDVAGTNAAPVECFEVDVLLSTNSGLSFDKTLARNIANDGSEWLDFPAGESDSAKIKVKCADNVFFAVSPGTFSYVGESQPIPHLEDDQYLVLVNSSTRFFNVFNNDVIANRSSSVIIHSEGDQGGTIEAIAQGFYYTPAPNFEGIETFSYRVMTETGQETSAEVTVVVKQSTVISSNQTNASLAPANNNSQSSSKGGGSFALVSLGLFLVLALFRQRRAIPDAVCKIAKNQLNKNTL